jgi:uncharacterized protein YjbJ (UPF0337 family)
LKQGTKNKIEGKFHEARGTGKVRAGRATNNPDLETEGQTEKMVGMAQKNRTIGEDPRKIAGMAQMSAFRGQILHLEGISANCIKENSARRLWLLGCNRTVRQSDIDRSGRVGKYPSSCRLSCVVLGKRGFSHRSPKSNRGFREDRQIR